MAYYPDMILFCVVVSYYIIFFRQKQAADGMFFPAAIEISAGVWYNIAMSHDE